MAGYKKFIPEALKLIESRRIEAVSAADMRKNRVYSLEKRLGEIDNELSRTMLAVSRAVIAGGDVSDELSRIKDVNLKLRKEKEDILAKYSMTSEDLKPDYFCKLCGDTGYVGGEVCSCLKTRAKSLLYNSLATGAIQETKTFENFDLTKYPENDGNGKSSRARMEKLLADAKDFAEKFDNRNLLFIGRTGLGKTHISLAIANKLIDKGIDVIYTSAPSLFIKLEKERFSKDGNFSEMLDSVIGCDLLIIDDLGAEMRTQFTVSSLYQIINERLNSKRPMIINTNLSVTDIDKNYEERIASRIFGSFDAYLFTGNDIRRMIKN